MKRLVAVTPENVNKSISIISSENKLPYMPAWSTRFICRWSLDDTHSRASGSRTWEAFDGRSWHNFVTKVNALNWDVKVWLQDSRNNFRLLSRSLNLNISTSIWLRNVKATKYDVMTIFCWASPIVFLSRKVFWAIKTLEMYCRRSNDSMLLLQITTFFSSGVLWRGGNVPRVLSEFCRFWIWPTKYATSTSISWRTSLF